MPKRGFRAKRIGGDNPASLDAIAAFRKRCALAQHPARGTLRMTTAFHHCPPLKRAPILTSCRGSLAPCADIRIASVCFVSLLGFG